MQSTHTNSPRQRSRVWRCLAGSALALCFLVAKPQPAYAQLNSPEVTAVLTALLPESLTVTLLPGATAFTLNGGASNPAALPLVVTSVWTFAGTRTSFAVYGYFSSASNALTHVLSANSVDIPAARVEVSVNGGSNLAFNQTVAFGAASAGRQLYSQSISLLNSVGTRTDSLQLNINLAGLVLAADTYIGTLRVRAQATP